MSTGQNDPYTAAQAVHHLTSLMADASRRSFAAHQFRDGSGNVRVIVPIMGFPTHLKVVCGHTRQGGLERHPRVTLELLRMLGVIGGTAVGERRVQVIRREVEVVMADAARMIPTQTDLDEVLGLGKDVLSFIDGRDGERCAAGTPWQPSPPHSDRDAGPADWERLATVEAPSQFPTRRADYGTS
jgi:uncharacterized membrane protein